MLRKIKLIGIVCVLLFSFTACGGSKTPFSTAEFLTSVETIVKDETGEIGTLASDVEIDTFEAFSGEIETILADLEEYKDAYLEKFDNDEVEFEKFKNYFREYGKLVTFIGAVKPEDLKIDYYGSKMEDSESLAYGIVTYEFAEGVDLTALKEVDFKNLNDYYNNTDNFKLTEGEGVYYELKDNVLVNLLGKYYANIDEIKAKIK